MDRSVMHMLRGLADDGRTVIVVTHSVLSLEVCDRLLVLAPGGRIAYYGPPEDALAFFGFEEWPEAFEAFENDRDRDWAATYADSSFRRQYIDNATAQPHLPPTAPGTLVAPPGCATQHPGAPVRLRGRATGPPTWSSWSRRRSR